MDTIINLFGSTPFIIAGGISTCLVFASIIYSTFLTIKGVLPVWIRLGYGLSNRKIAIVAEGEGFDDLKKLLIDSSMFKEGNIEKLTKQTIDKVQSFNMILLYYPDLGSELDEILRRKKYGASLIVYVPTSHGFLEKGIMEKIGNKSNSIVTNFRGRLLNDVLTSMITTSY